jgi:hypothetical protein
MSSGNRDNVTISLPMCILFISSSYLIALARNFRAMLNRSGEREHPCHIPQLNMTLTIGLSYIAFIVLKYIPSILTFLRAFIMKWCLILSKAFSASIEMIKSFLCLLVLMCYITFFNLCMLNQPCTHEMNPTWSWWMIFLICCCIQIVFILLRIFASTFIKEREKKYSLRSVARSSPFRMCSCLSFWIIVILTS